jgi:hypothetical protein
MGFGDEAEQRMLESICKRFADAEIGAAIAFLASLAQLYHWNQFAVDGGRRHVCRVVRNSSMEFCPGAVGNWWIKL